MLTKPESERRVFETLAGIMGLAVVPDSISQADPPRPDIECLIDGYGPLAVELVALDAEDTRLRLSNMFSTEDAWRSALALWPEAQQEQLRQECRDVFLGLQIENRAGRRVRTSLMRLVQGRLLARPAGFVGDLFADHELPEMLLGARVHRGGVTNGPRVFAPSAGTLQPIQLGKIVEKLTAKNYDTEAPLELFAYSTHDEPDGYVGAVEAIEACVRSHMPGSRFRRVRVFDLAKARHVLSWPSEEW